MTMCPRHTLSMEVQASSDITHTERGSVHNLAVLTASPNGTSNSQRNDSDTTSTTTHSETDHNYNLIYTNLEDRHAIENFPTDIHYSLKDGFLYHNLSPYPTWIRQEDLHSTAASESLSPSTNGVQHYSANKSVKPQPQTRQDYHNNQSPFPTRIHTIDQNVCGDQSSIPKPPPSTAVPSRQTDQSDINLFSLHESKSLPRLQAWLGAYLTEERMRVGHQRWQNEEEGYGSLAEHILNRHLEQDHVENIHLTHVARND